MTAASTLIDQLLAGGEPEPTDLSEVFGHAFDGSVSSEALGGLLVALRTRPLRGEVLAAVAREVRKRSSAVVLPEDLRREAVDTCGTGGDGAGMFNVSTAAAITAASCGAVVAKHGNRAVSSKCGSADVLETLGFRIDSTTDREISTDLRRNRFAFLFAPRFHAALGAVANVRRELGVRTRRGHGAIELPADAVGEEPRLPVGGNEGIAIRQFVGEEARCFDERRGGAVDGLAAEGECIRRREAADRGGGIGLTAARRRLI